MAQRRGRGEGYLQREGGEEGGIGKGRFSTKIKLAQGRGRGGGDIYKGREGRREGGRWEKAY